MYFWKCWRDTRAFFVAFLIIAAAVIPLTALVCNGTGIMQEGFGRDAVVSTFGLLMTVITLGLGAIGAIHEFSDKAVHFLFTKPRSRAYFVWIGWLVGCIEVLGIAVVNLLAGSATLAFYHPGQYLSAFFGALKGFDIAGIFIYGVFVYGQTYALTAVLRSGLKGLGASLGATTGLWAFAAAIWARWRLHLPIPADHIGHLPVALSNAVWILTALLFVFGAQLVVERAEI
ncbi:MAG TPA: hypothetical protein VFF95_16675 [Candidatus Binatus sp.]|jgi:hypothetical protein|nr:hypothetical protein [Candidatus Binatus sp.]